MREIWPGSFVPVPLGARPQDGGTTFAVSSDVATSVTLCLFDEAGMEEQLPMPAYDAGVWRGFVPGVGRGQRYGYQSGESDWERYRGSVHDAWEESRTRRRAA